MLEFVGVVGEAGSIYVGEAGLVHSSSLSPKDHLQALLGTRWNHGLIDLHVDPRPDYAAVGPN